MKHRELTVYIAIAVIILSFATALYFFAKKPQKAPPPKLEEGTKAIVFKDVHYSGEKRGITDWEIKAKIARKYIDKPEVEMEVIEGRYMPKPDVIVLFTGSQGRMDTDEEKGSMKDVDIVYKEEYRLKTAYMDFDFKKGYTRTDAPVRVEGAKLNLDGIGLQADTNAQTVKIMKDVTGFIESSQGRYDFESNDFLYLLKENIYVLEGRVVMKGKDMHLTCDKLYVHSKDNETERVDAVGRVKLLSKGTLAKSDKAVYHFKDEKVTMTGSPKVVKDRVEMDGESVGYDVAAGKFSVNRPKMRIERKK
jgi:lipopolysaccharide transport protein LptA/LPS export ABC transporter protein LptC